MLMRMVTAPRPRVGGQSNSVRVVEEVSQGSQDIVATDVTAFQDYGDGDVGDDCASASADVR